jgi:tetratricopeptide (TPR) repeat protein
MKSSLVTCAFVVLALLPEQAVADDQSDLARAKALYEEAQLAEGAQQYNEAAQLYLEAYSHYADAEFFYNAGEVYRLAENTALAIVYFEKYLALEPHGRGADYARQMVASLAQGTEAKPDRPPSETLSPAPEPEREGHSARSEETPLISEHAPEHKSGRGLRIAGVTTVGASVILLGIGVYAGLQARSISEELTAATSWGPELEARYDEGSRYQTAMYVLGAAGVATAVTGGLLYLAGRQDDAPRASPSISLSPSGGIGFAAEGVF